MRFIIKISSVFLIYNVFLSAQIMVISQNKVVFSKMKEYGFKPATVISSNGEALESSF